jgi:hypothetical protein
MHINLRRIIIQRHRGTISFWECCRQKKIINEEKYRQFQDICCVVPGCKRLTRKDIRNYEGVYYNDQSYSLHRTHILAHDEVYYVDFLRGSSIISVNFYLYAHYTFKTCLYVLERLFFCYFLSCNEHWNCLNLYSCLRCRFSTVIPGTTWATGDNALNGVIREFYLILLEKEKEIFFWRIIVKQELTWSLDGIEGSVESSNSCWSVSISAVAIGLVLSEEKIFEKVYGVRPPSDGNSSPDPLGQVS